MTCRCRSLTTIVDALICASSLIPPANGIPTHLQPRSSLPTIGARIRLLPNHGARAVVVIFGSVSNNVSGTEALHNRRKSLGVGLGFLVRHLPPPASPAQAAHPTGPPPARASLPHSDT